MKGKGSMYHNIHTSITEMTFNRNYINEPQNREFFKKENITLPNTSRTLKVNYTR